MMFSSSTLLHASAPLPVLAVLLASCSSDGDDPIPPPTSTTDACQFAEAIDEYSVPAIHTPRWAFEPWISKDISDGPDTYAFVEGFQNRDIPVGVVVLDSPWETNYNTFVVNEERYPEFAQMVADLHADDIRIVLWVTQMVNTASFDFEVGGDVYAGMSPNWEPGCECGFFVEECAEYGWWKGSGSGVDFFDEQARAWWHRQQDALYELGINGWKLDFGESYITADPVQTAAGAVPHQEYSEAYYRDFFAYGAAKLGGLDEFVTMVRPYDESYQFEGRFFARPEHAPVGWVGDNRRDWIGLADALDHMFRSAEAGYAVVGSDVGGYLDRDDVHPTELVPFDTLNFARWTAIGALSPFMQLHGRGNMTPWTVPDHVAETEALYRYWSVLHHQLVPFFYSLAEQTYAGGATVLRPIGAAEEWPGDYRYMLGEALLVAPILDATGIRDVALPTGAEWYDWWAPAADPLAGGQTLSAYDATARERVPLFVRAGAIIPAVVARDVTSLGTTASAGYLTLLVYPATGGSQTSFTMYEDDGSTLTITAVAQGSGAEMTLEAAPMGAILRVRSDVVPSGVTIGAGAATAHASRAAFDGAASGWWHDASSRFTWIKLAATSSAQTIVLTSP